MFPRNVCIYLQVQMDLQARNPTPTTLLLLLNFMFFNHFTGSVQQYFYINIIIMKVNVCSKVRVFLDDRRVVTTYCVLPPSSP
jgi:hypothetical protein